MRPDTNRAHHWAFDYREDDGDEGGYAVMGGGNQISLQC